MKKPRNYIRARPAPVATTDPQLPAFVSDFRVYATSRGFVFPVRGRPAFQHRNGATAELVGPSSAGRAIVRVTDGDGPRTVELWSVPVPYHNGNGGRCP